jgi:enamine deaminase RidA (YjgF/YER057c/UK114 family)
MKLLGGDLIILGSEVSEDPLIDQVKNCLDRLLLLCGKMKLSARSFYKAILFLNFEGDDRSLKAITDLVRATLHGDMVVLLLYQPPIQGDVVMEAYYFDPARWNCTFHSAASGEAVVFGGNGVKITTGFSRAVEDDYRSNTVKVFDGLEDLLSGTGFFMRDIVRQWNYMEHILRYEGPYQHYQLFNEARAGYYGDHFRQGGFPAGTGIGTCGGGVIIEYIAVSDPDADTLPIDNPEQVPAYMYQQELLKGEAVDRVKSTPRFERGRYLSAAGMEMVFVSGTAAIRGQHVVYPDNSELQTLYTMDNIEQLITQKNLKKNGIMAGNFVFDYIRIYLKDRDDYPGVQKHCHEKYGDVPCVWLEADVCRDELMVEIEGYLVKRPGHRSST